MARLVTSPSRWSYFFSPVPVPVRGGAALAAYSIQQEFESSERTHMRAVFGVYLLETREIWTPRVGNAKGIGLAAAPHELAGFIELGNAVVQSERIVSYIEP